MKNFINLMMLTTLMNEMPSPDGVGSSGGGSGAAPETTAPEKDQYGYDKMPEPKSEEKAPEEKAPEPVTPEKDSTGYGEGSEKDSTGYGEGSEKDSTGYGEDDKAPEDDKKPEDKTPEEVEAEVKETEEKISKALETLPKNEIEAITKFAKENGVTEAQAKAYADLRNKEIAEAKEAQKAHTIEIRKQWKTELMEDKEFGGDNFVKNVAKVDKVMKDFMPNLQKRLTDSGNVVPPYIMRDLLNLHKVLNPVNSLVNGEGDNPAPKEEEDVLNILYK